jgi:hypothetical protein
MEAVMKEKISSITEKLDQAIQRISIDMTTLVHEHMASMQNNLIHAAEARENQLISKLLKAMTSDDSPYATHTQLQCVMASIEAIVQKVTPLLACPHRQLENATNRYKHTHSRHDSIRKKCRQAKYPKATNRITKYYQRPHSQTRPRTVSTTDQ